MLSQATIKIAFDGAAECFAIQRARLRKALAVMIGCDKDQRHRIDHLPMCFSYFNLEDAFVWTMIRREGHPAQLHAP
jgi:hypothetical protein